MADAAGPSAEALLLCDEVVDMLMLLDYEVKFCNMEMRPLSRTYFAIPAPNSAQQFKYFTQLLVWLLKTRDPRWEATWDEYDDPNTLMTNLMVVLKDANIQVNAVPAKLKTGCGDSVCQVLHSTLKEVLRQTRFEWGAPEYPDEDMADEAHVDSDAEIHSVDEEDMPADGEEDDLMYQEDDVKKKGGYDSDDDHAVLDSKIDPKQWLLEVERVAPKLKIQMPNDSKEWRNHLQQTRSYKQVIETQFPTAKVQLEKLSTNLSSALDKIKGKEAFINTQFDQRALDYRQQQEELTQVQSQYTHSNEVVMNLQIELKNIQEELEVVKTDMEERSSTVTDTAPIVKMKDAFKKLRTDTRQLEVRIGVVSHTLMQAKLRQRPEEDRRRGGYAGGPGAQEEDRYDEDDGGRL